MDLAPIRSALLTLHRELVDLERRHYEKTHGRMASADFLQALINEPAFAWLAPLTTLIVRLEELAEGEDADVLVAEARRLLAPGRRAFHTRYAEHVQESPEVAFAHGAAVRALKG